ncbi:MAG: tRNA dihydrouridine(20/20a) synthase DusA [Hoeflea sp.]|uniref:tRNA dihydrouridine(20/20a) synthase DusA n=1 Tax=Hoeflea sp. TaxID=1940281 RepID=UPI000C0EB6C0|nr:tRNA dihydrouridine(20/20a) synthase DusA [Hoeflea sp.]PHR18335.1 MAG: tRNA dihydrouridine(20/20a) synthase DusA [Hoeflea sp.]
MSRYPQHRFAVAPMMDWTDRHCRFLHRQLSRQALLYTEMVVADGIIHGDRDRLLGFDQVEHPVALQLGGSEPDKLVEAVRIATDFGYDEINLNVGCPSDRVQSGAFGACLMREAELVARCVTTMKTVADVPVTVKCRIGVDEQDPEIVLPDFVRTVVDAGVDALWVHARKAWLEGLSPKENRDIPPLDYGIVYRLKRDYPNLFIGINGGVATLNQADEHLNHVDGVMLGRAAYHNTSLLAEVDRQVYGDDVAETDWGAVCASMMAHAEAHLAAGGRLIHVTRHMIGLFQGVRGARRFRQILSTDAVRPGAGPEVIAAAFEAINFADLTEAA